MTDTEFDDALIAAAFEIAAAEGWRAVTPAAAARRAALPLDRTRQRFPSTSAILFRFGQRADAEALADAAEDGTPRDRLFDLIMRRFDALQPHREGIRALLRALPMNPGLGTGLALATGQSIGWMLEGAGIGTEGVTGALRVHGLGAVWIYTLRTWLGDDSPDLSGTMAALDRALTRAEQFGDLLNGRRPGQGEATPKPFPEPPISEPATFEVPAAGSPVPEPPLTGPAGAEPPVSPSAPNTAAGDI